MYVAAGITEEERRAEELALRRREIELYETEIKQRRTDTVLETAKTIATVAIPILAFVGVSRLKDLFKR